MNKILKFILILLPIIYSFLKLNIDNVFYFIFILIWCLLLIIYLFKKSKVYFNYLWQFGISYIFLDWTFHQINFRLFIGGFKLINFWLLLPIIILTYFTVYLRAIKWKYLLNHIKPVRTSSLLKTTVVGFMLNGIFPARMGEFYRAYMLGEQEQLSKSTVFATIILERVFDGLVVGLGVLYIFLLKIVKSSVFYFTGIIGIGVYILAILSLVIFYFQKDIILKIIKFFLFFLPGNIKRNVISWLDLFYEGLHVFKNFKNLFAFTILTVLIWLINVYYQYLYLLSMHIFEYINIPISPINFSVLLTCLIVIGITIPSGPGGLGPLQKFIFFAFIFVCPWFSVKNAYQYNLVASFSMYLWLSSILLLVIPGLFIMFKEKLKIKIG